jgi:hypothetical protein
MIFFKFSLFVRIASHLAIDSCTSSMSDFSLINEVLRNPDALVQDETLWHVTRLKQAIEQIPQGLRNSLSCIRISCLSHAYAVQITFPRSLRRRSRNLLSCASHYATGPSDKMADCVVMACFSLNFF